MNYRKQVIQVLFFALWCAFSFSCRDKKNPVEKDIVKKPEQLQEHLSDDLKKIMEYAHGNKGNMNDSIHLNYLHVDSGFYEAKNYESIWSDHGKWSPLGDSLYDFIQHADEYGLFPQDYH